MADYHRLLEERVRPNRTAGSGFIFIVGEHHRRAVYDFLASDPDPDNDRPTLVLSAEEAARDWFPEGALDEDRFHAGFQAALDQLGVPLDNTTVIGEVGDVLWRRGRLDQVEAIEAACDRMMATSGIRIDCLYSGNLRAVVPRLVHEIAAMHA